MLSPLRATWRALSVGATPAAASADSQNAGHDAAARAAAASASLAAAGAVPARTVGRVTLRHRKGPKVSVRTFLTLAARSVS